MGPESPSKKQLSVIIPIADRFDELETIHLGYAGGLVMPDDAVEFVYVLDGPNPKALAALLRLRNRGEPISIVPLPQRYGQTACLREGIRRASADTIVVLPPYLQVVPDSIAKLLEALEHADFVVAKRDRRRDNIVNKLRGRGMRELSRLAGSHYGDLGCVARAFRREVLADVLAWDGPYAFLPLFVERAGFVVTEVQLPQALSDTRIRTHRPSSYFDHLLDLVTIAFLLKFTNRPFRFFGSIGFFATILGVLIGIEMVVERFFAGTPMHDRPLLILAVLLVVLGIQIAAVGLIAEIIIFTRTNVKSTYRIREVVEQLPDVPPTSRLGRSPAGLFNATPKTS
jgi:hypothetical protein